jgi:hypothetical protein
MPDKKILEDVNFLSPDDYQYTPERFVESKSGSKLHILGHIEGKFAHADVPTANNRRYGRGVMESNLKRLASNIEARGVYGELDHPSDGRTLFQRVSHIVTRLDMKEDGQVFGGWDILDTPNGRIQQAICKAHGRLGTSSRGVGTTTPGKDGIEDVNNDFMLVTFDAVVDPAAKDAYPKLVKEAKDLRQIEEMVVTYEVLKRDFPGLTDELTEHVLKEHKKTQVQVPGNFEGFDHAVEIVRGEFQTKLAEQKDEFRTLTLDAIAQYREQVAEEEREKLLSTLTPVQDRAALEEVGRILSRRNILVPEEFKGRIEDLQRALEDAQGRYRALEASYGKLDEQTKLLASMGEQLTLLLDAEKALGGKGYRQAVLDLLGSPVKHTKDEWKKALDSAIAEFDKKENENKDLKAQADLDLLEKERTEHREALSRLENQLGEIEKARSEEIDKIKSQHEVVVGEHRAEVESWKKRYEEANQKATDLVSKYEALYAEAKRVEGEANADEKKYEHKIRTLEDRNKELKSEVEAVSRKVEVERMLSGRSDAAKLRSLVDRATSIEEAAEIIKNAVTSTPMEPPQPRGVQVVKDDDGGDGTKPFGASMEFQEQMQRLGVDPKTISG